MDFHMDEYKEKQSDVGFSLFMGPIDRKSQTLSLKY